MDLISTLRYEAQKRKEEEERKAKEAEAAAQTEPHGEASDDSGAAGPTAATEAPTDEG